MLNSEVQRLHDQRANLCWQPAIENERAVVVIAEVHAAALLLTRLA